MATEDQLAMAIEALAEHVVLFDAEDRIVLANRAWRELNADVAELTKPGTLFKDHLQGLLDNKLVPEAIGREDAWLRERMERHVNPSGAFDVVRQSGRHVRIFEQRLPNGGTILIVSDITESHRVVRALQDSEERFRAVVSNSPAKIHIKDLEGRYILVNPLAEELYGFSEAEAQGKTTHEIFPREQADTYREHDLKVMADRRAVEQEEVWTREDGIHTFLTVKFPILSHTGEVTGVGAIGTDITDRKRTEERLQESEKALKERVAQLEEAQRQLKRQEANLMKLAADLNAARDQAERANRSKSEFLAAMSHELRTPLNAIIGFSEIIQTEKLGPVGTERYRDYAIDINESGQHLLELINDILDLSKVSSGVEELHEESIDVVNFVPSVLRLVKQRAQEQDIKLTTELPDRLPLVNADQRKLKQILVNLLSNAIKFTEGGGTVTLEISCDDGAYCFVVADTGIGIADADIAQAMAQFGQVDSALNRQHTGTGLGLPLTKALTELHGGTLDLQSTVGVGTRITVQFPAERTVNESSDQVRRAAPA